MCIRDRIKDRNEAPTPVNQEIRIAAPKHSAPEIVSKNGNETEKSLLIKDLWHFIENRGDTSDKQFSLLQERVLKHVWEEFNT